MRAAEILRAAFATLALGGCVAILDVDSDDYQDVDEAVCTCFDGEPAVCEGLVQAVLGDTDGAEETLKTCLGESTACNELVACVRESDLCIAADGPCRVVQEGKLGFGCCDGRSCVDNRCQEACAPPQAACGAPSACCGAPQTATCEGSVCCATFGSACAADEDCCGDEGVECRDRAVGGRACQECTPEGFSPGAQAPCCGGAAALPDTGLCPPIPGG